LSFNVYDHSHAMSLQAQSAT